MGKINRENRIQTPVGIIVRIILSLTVFWGISVFLPEIWAVLLVSWLPENSDWVNYLLFTIGNLIITAGVAFPLFCLCMGVPFKEIKPLFQKSETENISVLQYIVLGFSITLPVGLLQVGLLLFDFITVEMLTLGTGVILLTTILQSIVVMPIVEEMMFRGVVIQKLHKNKKSTILIVSTLAFAAGHLNPVNLLIALPAGIVLALVRLKTGSIRYTVFLHIIVNICGILLWPFVLGMVF